MSITELRLQSTTSIEHLCRKYRIREMAVFGSVARAEDRADSAVDIFVEFEPGYHPGLGWFDLEEELASLVGRRVDLSRKSLLKPRVKREALRDVDRLDDRLTAAADAMEFHGGLTRDRFETEKRNAWHFCIP